MHKIQDELKEAKEMIKKKDDEISKIRDLNEALIKEVQKLKQGMISKGNWENDEAMEELRKKNKEICRLRNHNK